MELETLRGKVEELNDEVRVHMEEVQIVFLKIEIVEGTTSPSAGPTFGGAKHSEGSTSKSPRAFGIQARKKWRRGLCITEFPHLILTA